MINFSIKTIFVLLAFLLSCISCSDEVIQPLEKDEAYNLAVSFLLSGNDF
jgi:cytochrome c peroxidase